MAVLGRSKVTFLTRQTAVRKVVNRLLGFEDEEIPAGFRWDERHLSVADKIETLPFPGLKKSHLKAVPRSYFQNGPVDIVTGKSLKIEDVRKEFRSGTEKWTPKVHNGGFTVWRDSDFLFSDNSVVEYVSLTNVDGGDRSYHTLTKERANDSIIRAAIYKRSNTNENVVWKNYQQRFRFTSILDSDGNPTTTRDGDTITWSNVDTTKREFITFIREERVYLQFNQNVVEAITSTTAPVDILDFNDKEFAGTSDGLDEQIFELEYFPIISTDLAVYVVNSSLGTWTEYTVVDSFTGLNQVKVDIELGKLIFGTSTSGGAPPTNNDIYVSYKAVPRIEYEEVGYDKYRTGFDANINPLGQSLNKGFVVVSRSELDISSIVLETDKQRYNSFADTYGPIYAGADHAQLIATVFSSAGKPIPDAEILFEMEYEPATGSIGNSGATAEYRTGYDGKARTFYTTPNSAEDMGFYVRSVTGTNQLQVRSDANFTDSNDIYTYQVLKDDPWIGKAGADTSIGEVEWNPDLLNGRKTILYEWDATAINPVTGIVGAYAPLIPTAISSDGSLLTYSQTLEEPDNTTDAPPTGKNLGAYWVVSDRTVAIKASVWSPRFKRRIYSNTIYLRVELPEYMKGVYVNDALQRIPFGLRVPDDTYLVASAIGGATFISINPFAGPYNIVDVIAGETLTWEEFDPYTYSYPYGTYDVSRPFAYFTFKFTIG